MSRAILSSACAKLNSLLVRPGGRTVAPNKLSSSNSSSSSNSNKLAGKMSSPTTVTLSDFGAIPATLPEGLSLEQLMEFHAFKNWITTLTKSLALQARDPSHPFHADPYVLRSIKVQAYDRWSCRIGFMKALANVTNAAGEMLPCSVFLRGPSVAMLVMLVPDDVEPGRQEYEDQRHVLLTVQPRLPAGSLAFVELPAGMVDREGAFAGTAAQEIKEELGLEIPAADLVCLTELAGAPEQPGGGGEALPSAMFPSAGGCDEYVAIYAYEKRVPRSQLGEWTGRLTGLREEMEKITLKLVPMRDLWREGARDAKALSALALWEGLRREGKL